MTSPTYKLFAEYLSDTAIYCEDVSITSGDTVEAKVQYNATDGEYWGYVWKNGSIVCVKHQSYTWSDPPNNYYASFIGERSLGPHGRRDSLAKFGTFTMTGVALKHSATWTGLYSLYPDSTKRIIMSNHCGENIYIGPVTKPGGDWSDQFIGTYYPCRGT